jgi:F0F1-type ATP synthase assembly protein I
MLHTFVLILIIAAVAYVGFWIIDRAGTPHPFNMILKLLVGGIALVYLLKQTGLLQGSGL